MLEISYFVIAARKAKMWKKVSLELCLKITEKVSFNITSEASYIYILSGQKFIQKCQKRPIWASFMNLLSLRSNSVTRTVNFNRTKLVAKCQNSNATFWVIFKHCDWDFFVIFSIQIVIQYWSRLAKVTFVNIWWSRKLDQTNSKTINCRLSF